MVDPHFIDSCELELVWLCGIEHHLGDTSQETMRVFTNFCLLHPRKGFLLSSTSQQLAENTLLKSVFLFDRKLLESRDWHNMHFFFNSMPRYISLGRFGYSIVKNKPWNLRRLTHESLFLAYIKSTGSQFSSDQYPGTHAGLTWTSRLLRQKKRRIEGHVSALKFLAQS